MTTPLRTPASRFLVDAAVREGQRLELPAAQARHARARRLRPGDPVVLIDGRGGGHDGRILAVGARSVQVQVGPPRPFRENESLLRLTLAMGAVKGSRMDWAVEKATELGVDRIVPVLCGRSVVKPSAERVRRWQALCAAAALQCGRSVVPAVERLRPLDSLLDDPSEMRLICALDRAGPFGDALPGRRPATALVLVGPEGGWEEGEQERFEAAGFRPVYLGPRTLRAETAAVAVVAFCQLAWGDLGRRPF